MEQIRHAGEAIASPEVPKDIKGRVHAFSETGTEGMWWAFQDETFIKPPKQGEKYENWLYEGLHLLENGDKVTIYSKDKPEDILWEGIISVQGDKLSYAHWGQNDIDPDVWAQYFFDENPAKLTPKEDL